MIASRCDRRVPDPVGPRERLIHFVADESDGVRRRIDVEPDDLVQLVRETRIVGQLELARPVRLQAVLAPDPLHRADADAAVSCHGISRPVRRLTGRVAPACGRRQLARPPCRAAVRAGRVLSRSSPATPSVMRRSCQRQTVVLAVSVRRMTSAVPQPSAVSKTIRVRQTCFCGLFRSAATELLTISGIQVDCDAGAHAADLHSRTIEGIQNRIQPLGFIH